MVILHRLSHYASKSVKGSDIYACLRKKAALYSNHLPRSTPWMDCHQIWCGRSSCGRKQLCQFLAIASRVSILEEVKIRPFPLTWGVAVNSTALPVMAKHSWCKIQFVDQGIFEIFAVRNWISFKISADFCLVSFSSAVAFRYWEWQPVSDSRIMLCGCISSEDGCHARTSVNEWMNEWMNEWLRGWHSSVAGYESC